MKCPKCSYLGFDTGVRCKNCGYDFSLMAVEEPAAELSLRLDTDEPRSQDWRAQFDNALAAPPAQASPAPTPVTTAPVAALEFEPTLPPTSFRGAPALPLFGVSPAGEDEPLIKVPSRPRAPLSVRRTPDPARLRSVPRPVERPAPEPEFSFADEPSPPAAAPVAPVAPAAPAPTARAARPALEPALASPPVPRLIAAAIDHAILLTIDVIVLYLTLRIASLTMSEWTTLAILPMATFLGLLKLSYFTAFTCVGGQTIGKMATGIRVVRDDHRPLDAALAVHRALAGALSFITLGAGFVPALVGSDRRALHDRLAHTRVVTLPAA